MQNTAATNGKSESSRTAIVNTAIDPLILRLDITGRPQRWIPWQDAVILDAREMIAWTAGERTFTFYGGINRLSGCRSHITVNSIIAVRGRSRNAGDERLVPPLSNRELFLRDGHLCMYCGRQFPGHLLTRDHLVPSRAAAPTAGATSWPPAGDATTQRGPARPKRQARACWRYRTFPIGRSTWSCRTGAFSPTRWSF